MSKVILNNKLVEMDKAYVHILDRGYQFGDGVYEVIRFYNGVLFELDAHLERFKRSVEEIGIPFEYDLEQMKKEFEYLVVDSGYGSGYIYSQISRGVMKRNHIYVGHDELKSQYVAYAVQEEERPLEAMEKGIKVLLHEDIRWLRCDVKSLNLLGSVMIKNKAYERGAKEAVLHRDGNITEGSATNVFCVKDGVLYTHPANHLILNGITRKVILRAAKELGIPVRETPFMVELFRNSDEAFTSASVSEISPIVKYDYEINGVYYEGTIGNGVRGEITARLQQKYNEYI